MARARGLMHVVVLRARLGAPIIAGRPGPRCGGARREGGGAMSSEIWRSSPVLGVQNVRRAAEYYRDVLGFALDPVDGIFQPTNDEPGGVYGIVERGGVRIHFQIRRRELPDAKRPLFERDVYVYVDDVDAVHADLQRRGAVIIQSPRRMPYGLHELVVEDLNGHRLAFGEPAR